MILDGQPVLKPTRWLSNCPAVLAALSKTCDGSHSHAPILGGDRSKRCQVYPKPLCMAIAKGLYKQLVKDAELGSLMLNAMEARLAQSDIDCQTSFSENCWRRICSNDMGEDAQGDGSVVASVCDLENLLSHPDPDPTALIASLHPIRPAFGQRPNPRYTGDNLYKKQ